MTKEKVYIVTAWSYDDGRYIVGVFKTKSKAKAYVKKNKAHYDSGLSTLDIEVHNLKD